MKDLESEQGKAPNDTNTECLNKKVQEVQEIADYKTKGLILQSQTRWYEKGEKSNNYFLNLISRNQIKNSMNKAKRQDGTFTSRNTEILALQASFYE